MRLQASFFSYLALLVVLMLTSCAGEVILDNPTLEPLLVTIGSEEFAVEADTSRNVSVPQGTHNIIISKMDGTVSYDGEVSIKGPGLVNLGATGYVLEAELYVNHALSRAEYLNNLDQSRLIQIGDREFRGDLTYFDSTTIFLPKIWNYGPKKSFPNQISLAQSQEFEVKHKLWREDDFLENRADELELLQEESDTVEFPEDSLLVPVPTEIMDTIQMEPDPIDTLIPDTLLPDSAT